MDSSQRSVIVSQTSRENVRGDIRRAGETVHPELGYNGCRTLYEGFRRGHKLNALGACLGFRAISTNGLATPYIYTSYTEVLARINAFAAGLHALNLVPPTQDDGNMILIGLYMANSMEWFISEQAIFCFSGATVPFYDTLGPESVQFILNQTSTKTVVCSRKELPRLCTVKMSGRCPYFEVVVLVDGVTTNAAKIGKAAGLSVMSFAKVEAVGAHHIDTEGFKHSPPSGKDVFTFCYTSGTTGDPKGALLTHENMIAAISDFCRIFPMEITDRHLSYLPLAHIFERIVMAQTYVQGASIAFFRGDPLLLIEDLQACRPTIFPAAPRVLNKIYDKIQIGISNAGGMKKKLFDAAVATKTKNLTTKGVLTHAVYDRLIFNKIKKGLGMDCIRSMVSGSAPLSKNVMLFYRVMLGVPVIEGYGQTENAACCSISLLEDMTTCGHVGIPSPAVEIVLADVPDMGYRHTDTHHKGQPCQGRGEILARGPTVFKGYYKDPAKTKEAVDEEGWLHSGDIGLWTIDGNLQIIDRKKNIFKLSQGEYVAPEKIENVLTQSLIISQAFVYGDSLQNSLVAIIIPEEEPVRALLESLGEAALAKSFFSNICNNEKLKSIIIADMKRVGKSNGLHSFETPKSIYLSDELFSVENGFLTPTFKLKRHQARNKYEKQIEKMYASIPNQISKL